MSKSGKFIVKSLYNVLEPNIGGYFPMSGIWLSWVQPRVGFFAWEVVIPFTGGSALDQPPPDFKESIHVVYEEKMTKRFFTLFQGGEKLGYETKAFAIYDVMGYVKSPIFTLCVGNAWGEAALLLAAGAKGNRSALPSSTIMIKQPIARFQGQATDIDLARKEVKNVKAELVKLYAKHVGKSPEQIEADIRRPKYFSPSEAVEYGIIDKSGFHVGSNPFPRFYNERSSEDRGVVADLKKAQLI
ncbi:hypothetical protein PVL29_002144 [Vitis rotundifolia]|uniref:ATP-dependent Clp protease proteolytic subunit n=1 Tax=Vitis rotundifolia TaxID=103349 RepID=A0AA39AGF0_VITRO|nr:hypothetical protein PVL29_002144 [Vitis rotundifolia]